ncbi:DUF4147 domain-containing protein [Thiohalobacter sp.]|uniref:DUF4147 domain-containing protein n=1 Tax=Thiohalobacter sp. TaxID=2025948 RepID=UPI0026369928|nr:DUF4147 domain-containing protein [Thiohalobacter sp.]
MNPATHLRHRLLDLFQVGLAAVAGDRVTREALAGGRARPVHLLAVGKAAAAMAAGALQALEGRVERGLVVVPHGYPAEGLEALRVLTAGHPLPDADSLAAGAAARDFAAAVPPDRELLVLLSGGASALMEALPPGMTLDDLRRLTEWMLGSGLDIHAMNRVRQAVSRIKGGGLARCLRTPHAEVLLISDVPDDDPAAIGSGPLHAPLDGPLPAVPEALSRWVREDAPAGTRPLIPHRVIASVDDALAAIAAEAGRMGLRCRRVPGRFSGNAETLGRRFATELVEGPPQLWLAGGESNVHLPPHPGRGGRNQHLALAAARVLAGVGDCALLAAGTDGRDGPTPDAGALVDGGTIARGRAQGLDPEAALAAADAGRFLEASGDLLHTGPTGTNVADLVLGLRQPGVDVQCSHECR